MGTPLRMGLLWGGGFAFFTVVDLLWIRVVAARLYQSQVGGLLVSGGEMTGGRVAAALLTWVLIVLGVLCFALPRGVQSGSALAALGWGALLGLVIYGVYDLTNYAVLRGWTLKVTLADIAWGTFACGMLGFLLYAADKTLFRHGASL